MPRRLAHLLAMLTASATAVAGIPLLAAALTPASPAGACFCKVPFESEDGAESRGAGSVEEREEKEQQEEDGDGERRVSTTGWATGRPADDADGVTAADGRVPLRRFQGPAFSIRGPPAG